MKAAMSRLTLVLAVLMVAGFAMFECAHAQRAMAHPLPRPTAARTHAATVAHPHRLSR